jgi:hypothetical protein
MESVIQPGLIIDTELWENYDFEGMLINPQDMNKGMLVMSERNDTFTLRIYKLQLLDGNQYGKEKLLTKKSFKTAANLQNFLNTFSTFKADQFTEFYRKYDKKKNK